MEQPRVILIEAKDKSQLNESRIIKVEVPDSKGNLRSVDIDEGPIMDYLVNEFLN